MQTYSVAALAHVMQHEGQGIVGFANATAARATSERQAITVVILLLMMVIIGEFMFVSTRIFTKTFQSGGGQG
jgi:hypothetical protein